MMDGGRSERHCPHRPSRGKKRRSSDYSLGPLSLHGASERRPHTRGFFGRMLSKAKPPTAAAAATAAQALIRMATTEGDEPSVAAVVERSGNGANAGEEKSSVNPTAASRRWRWQTPGWGNGGLTYAERERQVSQSLPPSEPPPTTHNAFS